MYDLIIIGGGPAGVSAGIYAARKQMKVLLLTESIGGQSIVSREMDNWVGEPKISGVELAQRLEKHLRSYESIEIKLGEKVESVSRELVEAEQKVSWSKYYSVSAFDNSRYMFKVKTANNIYEGKIVLVASGGRRKRLNVPGEKELNGKGVAYCSTCDAPFFRNKTVAVVGAGNSGVEAVLDLDAYAAKIYLLVSSDALKGDQLTQEKIKNNPKTTIIYNTQVSEILGENKVTGLKYLDKISSETKELALDGVFVEVGLMPNSEPVKDLVNLSARGEILIDHKTGATSCPGIFAAGDVTDGLYRQNNISVGDGVKAVLSAYNFWQAQNQSR